MRWIDLGQDVRKQFHKTADAGSKSREIMFKRM